MSNCHHIPYADTSSDERIQYCFLDQRKRRKPIISYFANAWVAKLHKPVRGRAALIAFAEYYKKKHSWFNNALTSKRSWKLHFSLYTVHSKCCLLIKNIGGFHILQNMKTTWFENICAALNRCRAHHQLFCRDFITIAIPCKNVLAAILINCSSWMSASSLSTWRAYPWELEVIALGKQEPSALHLKKFKFLGLFETL